MTQQEIEAFLAVVRMGSVSGAAQAMYITQPAVSRHIRALERELGCPLLVRGRGQRQVELTDQGRDFVDVAEKWRLVWREAREVASRDRAKTLNVASVGSVSTFLLPPVFRDFLEEKFGRALTFHNYHSQEAYDYVAEGLADIALISDDQYHPQVETIPAFREPMVLVTGPDSPLPPQRPPISAGPGQGAAPALEPGIRPVALLLVLQWSPAPCGSGPDVPAGGLFLLGVGRQLGGGPQHRGSGPPATAAGAAAPAGGWSPR